MVTGQPAVGEKNAQAKFGAKKRICFFFMRRSLNAFPRAIKSRTRARGCPLAPRLLALAMAHDATLELINEALNHAVRSRAENPLLHMARVLRSGRQAQLAVESRARAKQEAEVAAQGIGEGDEAGGSSQGATLVTVVPLTVEELEKILRTAGIDISQWGTANAKATSHLLTLTLTLTLVLTLTLTLTRWCRTCGTRGRSCTSLLASARCYAG